jgi:hypothetical protein
MLTNSNYPPRSEEHILCSTFHYSVHSPLMKFSNDLSHVLLRQLSMMGTRSSRWKRSWTADYSTTISNTLYIGRDTDGQTTLGSLLGTLRLHDLSESSTPPIPKHLVAFLPAIFTQLPFQQYKNFMEPKVNKKLFD